MDKTQVIKMLEEVLSKNVDPQQAAIMKNIMQNFLKDVDQKDLDDLDICRAPAELCRYPIRC